MITVKETKEREGKPELSLRLQGWENIDLTQEPKVGRVVVKETGATLRKELGQVEWECTSSLDSAISPPLRCVSWTSSLILRRPTSSWMSF